MNKLLFTVAAIALLAGAAHLFSVNNVAPLQETASEHVLNEWKLWKQIHNKKYADPDYEFFRMKVFEENYKMIQAHNARNDETYSMAPNQFMDLTQEEFVQTYLTLQVPSTKTTVESADEVVVPNEAINWVAKGKVSGVKNQGSCGSCWAFSAVGALESLERINGQGTTSFSEQQLVDCSRSFGNQGCNGGWMDQAFQYVEKNGITDSTTYPYVARDQTCKHQGGSYKIKGHKDAAEGNCSAVQNDLAGRPLSVAVDATNWSFYRGGVFRNCNRNLNHGVLLVAVDASGNWTIKNSWGTAWGNAGFMTLAPGNTCGICDAASYPY